MLTAAKRPEFDLFEYNDGSERHACPVCEEPMELVWLELVRFDRCAEHGVWLEGGVLERVLAWDLMPKDVKDQLRAVETHRKNAPKDER
jgi:Zn-finger nucleic acid-binding protein